MPLTKGELLLGEELVFPELLDLAGKDLLRGRRAVDTAGLDGDQETTTRLEEELRVNADNTVDCQLPSLQNLRRVTETYRA